LDDLSHHTARIHAVRAPVSARARPSSSPCSQFSPGAGNRFRTFSAQKQRPGSDEDPPESRDSAEWNDELLAAYEELQIAQEELCEQNEELQAARLQLEAERQRYLELFDSAPDAYLVTDASGLVQAANRQAAALFAVPQKSLPGKPLSSYVEEKCHDDLQGLLQELQEKEQHVPHRAELRFQPRGGAAFDTAITVSTVTAGDGSPGTAGLRWLIRDISERKSADAERHRSQQEFRALVEHAPDIIARFDRELRHRYLNPAAEEVYEMARDELLGKTIHDLGLPEDLTAALEGEMRAVFDCGEQRTVQLAFPVDGDEWHFEARLAPEFAPDGTVESLLAVARNVTDRVRYEHELELERARLRTVIENAPVAILVADEQARVILANPAATALLGQPIPYNEPVAKRAELGLSYPSGEPYLPRDLPLSVAVLQGTSQRNVEMSLVVSDGQRRTILANAAPIADEQAKITGAVAILQDVTEREQTHEMLQRYAQRLQLLREVDKGILAARSAAEIAEKALPRARQLLACRRASVVIFDFEAGETRVLGVDAEDETDVSQGHELPLDGSWPIEQLARGESYIASDACTLANESLLAGELCEAGIGSFACVPLLAEGKLLGALTLGLEEKRPMTPDELEVAGQLADALAIGIEQARLHEEVKRRAQDLEISVARRTAALQASEARFRTIFEDSATGIALLDFEGRIIASNPALQRMLGYSARELLAKTFDELTHPEDVPKGHALYQELLAGKRGYYHLEKRYIRRDGSIIWVRPTVSLVRRTRGGPQYAIKTVEDISEQKKTQEALVQAEKLTIAGQLGASMAHEINNPLQAVIGCLGLAEESLVEGGDVGLYLRIAREELRRAARIVSQLRDLHRRSSPAEQEPTDLNEVLEQVLVLVRKQMEILEVQVEWERTDGLPRVLAVPDRIRQVFLNILLNAADAMPEGGHLGIEVSQTRDPDGVQVAFADSGVGIAPEDMKDIFEPFHSTKPEGLGLGMFIMRRIVTEHKGEIKIDSEPGRGTTVAVWLPLKQGIPVQEPSPEAGS
jgi:PAS domain S-box-containing protein